MHFLSVFIFSIVPTRNVTVSKAMKCVVFRFDAVAFILYMYKVICIKLYCIYVFM